MRVFGYGSLVNLTTHGLACEGPLRLDGWVRHWAQIASRPVAILSARPKAGCAIDGLVLTVPEVERPALLLREASYDAIECPDELTVFSIPAHKHPPAATPQPILLSYLDVVVQGFLRHFDQAGVARFFAETEGWGDVLDDRAAPIYPRAQVLTADERALCDRHIAALGLAVRRVPDAPGLVETLRPGPAP